MNSFARSSTEKPSVSVLLPAHNAGDYLFIAVESILAQSYSDFELIVLDDGSTDNSVIRLSTISDHRLIVIGNNTNQGLINTLNRGIECARAPLIARMDADDVAHRDRLMRQVEEFSRRPDLVLLGTNATLIDSKGQVFGSINVPSGYLNIRKVILNGNLFIHPSVMFRTKVIRDLGGYSCDAVHAEDYALWLEMVYDYVVDNLPESLMFYRVHTGQISQNKIAAQRRSVDIIRQKVWAKVSERCEELGIEPIRRQSFWGRMRGRDSTLGSDYRSRVRNYADMGEHLLALRTAISGLLCAPLAFGMLRDALPSCAFMFSKIHRKFK